MGPHRRGEPWADWNARMHARMRHSAQRSVSRAVVEATLQTHEPFLAWLNQQAPDAEVASAYTPINSILAEYLWAVLEGFAMSADSIVKGDGSIIEWNELPAWVQSLNHAEARHHRNLPDDKLTWETS